MKLRQLLFSIFFATLYLPFFAQLPITQGLQFGAGTADSKIFPFKYLDGDKLYAENASFDINTMQFDYAYDYGSYRVRTPMIKTPSGQLFHLSGGVNSGQDIYLMNINTNGTINWTKQITSGGYDRYYHLLPGFSDTLSIVGWHSAGGDKPMLIQTDLNGNVILNKMFDYGSDDQLSNNSILDKGGSITICNWDYYEGFYITNIDPSGVTNWCRLYNPVSGGLVVAPRNIKQTSDGGYVVLCYRRQHSTLAGDEAIVVKIDNALNVDWVNAISFPGISDIGIYHRLDLSGADDDIYFQTNGTKILGSNTNSSVYVKLNSSGQVVWAKTPTDKNQNVIPKNTYMFRDKDKLVFTGSLGSLSTYGQDDLIVVSTDTSFSACHADIPYQERMEAWSVAPFTPTVTDVNFNTVNTTIPASAVSYTFKVPYCSPPLSLELLYFDAKPLNETDAILNWETATEEDLNYFNIQRSENGIDWTTIAKMNAQGSGNQSHHYSYRDHEVYLPGTGKALFYYRLEAVETTGELDYSETRTVQFDSPEEEGTVVIKPNPAVDAFEFILYKSLGAIEGTTYEVVDVAGRILKQGQATGYRTTVELSEVASGIYFIRFSKNGIQNFSPQKLVVNR